MPASKPNYNAAMRYAFLTIAGTAFIAMCTGSTHQLFIVLVAGLLSAILFRCHKKETDDTGRK